MILNVIFFDFDRFECEKYPVKCFIVILNLLNYILFNVACAISGLQYHVWTSLFKNVHLINRKFHINISVIMILPLVMLFLFSICSITFRAYTVIYLKGPLTILFKSFIDVQGFTACSIITYLAMVLYEGI